jgi:CDP-6-deoxy-D-xylo-4-hexulose-3-dehydrase
MERRPSTHPHEAHSLRLDASKAISALRWRPRWSLDRALRMTVDWHRAHSRGEDMAAVSKTTDQQLLPGCREHRRHMTNTPLRNEILDLVERHAQETCATAAFQPGSTAIPAAGKVIGAGELRNMVDAVLDGWLTSGRFNAEFEQRLGQFLNVEHLLTTNSGSSANLLAFSALTSPSLGERAIKAGDEVITVAAGFPTTINPILQNGCVPVFVDIALPTYNIDTAQIEAAISSRTRAIMLAHTLGNPFDLAEVCRIAKKHGLWLIEDCCDALGSTYDGRPVGSFGDIGTLSFYPAHHITMGEGGAVFTRNPQLKRILESLRDWGRDCYCATGCDNTCGKRFEQQHGDLPFGYDHKYTYSQLGYNLKITDVQAACALAQLDRLPGLHRRTEKELRLA